MQRYPIERPNVCQLLNHSLFKQCKHTSLYEQFLLCGIEAIDCTIARVKSKLYSIDMLHDIPISSFDLFYC